MTTKNPSNATFDPSLVQKQAAARAALAHIERGSILGVGTGSTVNCLIELLTPDLVQGAVASSKATADLLRTRGIEVLSPNLVQKVALYIDGADEINAKGEMIKGGGGALTGEKTVAALAKKFICIADSSKNVVRLGAYPVAVEVLPDARSLAARALVALGGEPVYREGFVSDYGNVILDVFGLDLSNPKVMEEKLDGLIGVVCNGIFARHKADLLIQSGADGVRQVAFSTV